MNPGIPIIPVAPLIPAAPIPQRIPEVAKAIKPIEITPEKNMKNEELPAVTLSKTKKLDDKASKTIKLEDKKPGDKEVKQYVPIEKPAAKTKSEAYGIPILSQVYGAINSISMCVGRQHIMDYMRQITNNYLQPICEELEKMGEKKLAENVKKSAMWAPAYLLITRKLGDKLTSYVKNPKFREALKLVAIDGRKLSDKSLDMVCLAAMGKPILNTNNPFGLYGIELDQVLTAMTNPRGTEAYIPLFGNYTQVDSNNLKNEWKFEASGLDQKILRGEYEQPQSITPMPRFHGLE